MRPLRISKIKRYTAAKTAIDNSRSGIRTGFHQKRSKDTTIEALTLLRTKPPLRSNSKRRSEYVAASTKAHKYASRVVNAAPSIPKYGIRAKFKPKFNAAHITHMTAMNAVVFCKVTAMATTSYARKNPMATSGVTK